MPIAPIMIYGDDVSHVVTEEGVAYLYKASGPAERREAVAAIAGATPIGRDIDERRVDALRRDGLVALPEDLKVDVRRAERSLLAARSIEDLVAWSGGLYDPPAQFRTW
jgi:malonate decarboxylase alpha subunit